MFQRKQDERRGKGKASPTYKRLKRVAQLKESQKGRLLVRTPEACVQMVKAEGVELSDIYAELSLPKKKQKNETTSG